MARPPGFANYSKQEVCLLLAITEERLPITSDEWRTVAEQYCARKERSWADRQAASLHRKFTGLIAHSRTNSYPTLRELARTIKARMEQRHSSLLQQAQTGFTTNTPREQPSSSSEPEPMLPEAFSTRRTSLPANQQPQLAPEMQDQQLGTRTQQIQQPSAPMDHMPQSCPATYEAQLGSVQSHPFQQLSPPMHQALRLSSPMNQVHRLTQLTCPAEQVCPQAYPVQPPNLRSQRGEAVAVHAQQDYAEMSGVTSATEVSAARPIDKEPTDALRTDEEVCAERARANRAFDAPVSGANNSVGVSTLLELYHQIIELAVKVQLDADRRDVEREERERLERKSALERQQKMMSLIAALIKSKQ